MCLIHTYKHEEFLYSTDTKHNTFTISTYKVMKCSKCSKLIHIKLKVYKSIYLEEHMQQVRKLNALGYNKK